MKILFTSSAILFFVINISLSQQYWIEQNSGVTVQLTSVSKPQSFTNAGWICGYSGTVLRTTNWGQVWENVSGNGIPNTVSLINIFGIDASTALTAGYQGSDTWVWKTSNGGTNWVQVFSQPGGFINAIWVLFQTDGFMIGDPVGGRWSMWKSSDGGSTWDSTGLYLPQIGSETGYNNSLFWQTPKIWFGTNNSRIYYSSNDGANWLPESTPGQTNSFAIWFNYDGLNGLAGCSELLESSNSGGSWSLFPAPGTGNITGVSGSPVPVDNLPLYAYMWFTRSGGSSIYYSFGSSNWVTEYTAPSGTYRHMSLTLAPTGFWAVRTNGGISYHTPYAGVRQTSASSPQEFALSQNYPNPFNPVTRIKFDIASVGARYIVPVRIVIFDVLGQEIATLVNKKLQPGTYETEWDASNYPSGVYFYKLITADYTETKKMILIK